MTTLPEIAAPAWPLSTPLRTAFAKTPLAQWFAFLAWAQARGYPPQAAESLVVELTDLRWRAAVAVNRKINGISFGMETVDTWTLATDRHGEIIDGLCDCDTSALTKRWELARGGLWPLGALRPAIVRIPLTRDELSVHMVLVLMTDQGAYVLDNRIPLIVPWRLAGNYGVPYTWYWLAGESDRWLMIWSADGRWHPGQDQ